MVTPIPEASLNRYIIDDAVTLNRYSGKSGLELLSSAAVKNLKDEFKDLWTTEYPDPIVSNFSKHRAWLDHIFVSPNMISNKSDVKLVMNSGTIAPKTDLASMASDHFPIYCDFEF